MALQDTLLWIESISPIPKQKMSRIRPSHPRHSIAGDVAGDFHLFAIRCWHWESPEVPAVSGQQIKLLFLHRQKAEQAKPAYSVWALGSLMKGDKECPKSATNNMAAGKRNLKAVKSEEGGRGRGRGREEEPGWLGAQSSDTQGERCWDSQGSRPHGSCAERAARHRPAHLLLQVPLSRLLSLVTEWLGSPASPCHFSVIFLHYSTSPRDWNTSC